MPDPQTCGMLATKLAQANAKLAMDQQTLDAQTQELAHRFADYALSNATSQIDPGMPTPLTETSMLAHIAALLLAGDSASQIAAASYSGLIAFYGSSVLPLRGIVAADKISIIGIQAEQKAAGCIP